MSLTNGAIQRIISGFFVIKPRLQLLNLSILKDTNNNYLQCNLFDGIQVFPGVIKVHRDVTLQEESIILLELYNLIFSSQLGKNIIEISSFSLAIDTPSVDPTQVITPDLLDFSNKSNSEEATNEIPVVQDNIPIAESPSSHTSVIVSPSPISSASVASNTPSSSVQNMISPVVSPSKRSCSSYSTDFVMASVLHAKRGRTLFGKTLPIFKLNFQSFWTIKGRVTRKGTLGNLRREVGHWFCFELSDMSGTIKINAFRELSTRYFDLIQLGKVYSISRGELIPAKLQYNTTKHPREINLKDFSVINEETDFNDGDYPPIPSNFVKIASLKDLDAGAIVDTIGICVFLTLVNNGTRRSILILDDSAEIRLSIWNIPPQDFTPPIGSILVIRGARLIDQAYGRILSVSGYSSVQVNPNLPEVKLLVEWRCQNEPAITSASLSHGFFKDISLINSLPSSLQEDSVKYTNLEVTIISGVGHKYQAHSECGKRIKIYKRDIPVCEDCKDTLPDLLDQLVLTFMVSDTSGSVEVVAFTDIALELLSLSMDDLSHISDDDEVTSMLDCFTGKTFRFCIKSRETYYQGASHIQHSLKYFAKMTNSEV